MELFRRPLFMVRPIKKISITMPNVSGIDVKKWRSTTKHSTTYKSQRQIIFIPPYSQPLFIVLHVFDEKKIIKCIRFFNTESATYDLLHITYARKWNIVRIQTHKWSQNFSSNRHYYHHHHNHHHRHHTHIAFYYSKKE